MTSRLRRNFSRCKAKALSTIELQLNMRHDLTLRQTDTWVHDSAAPSLGKKNIQPSYQNIAKTAQGCIQIPQNAEELQISAKNFKRRAE